MVKNSKLPFFQRVWNSYIWTVTPIFHEKAGAILTPDDWVRKEADALDSPAINQSATSIPAVLRAIQLLSETVASLPLHVYRKLESGSRELVQNHPLNKILNKEPNKHMSSYLWRKVVVTNELLFGSGVTRIVRNGTTGNVVALRPLDSSKITPHYNQEKDEYYIKYQPDKNQPEERPQFSEDEIINVPWYTIDGFTGIAPIELCANALGVAIGQQQNQLNMTANDSRPPGLLVNQSATAEQATQAKASWQEAQSGKGKGQTAVLSGGWDYKILTMPNDQLQFIQQREFSVTEIARIFGVPPHLLADLDRATFSNIEHQGIEFVTYTLMGMLTNFEAELDRKLLTEEEKNDHYIQFNVNGLMRGDAKTRAEQYQSGIQNGWLKPDEARSFEEMNRVPGGDRTFIQMNMQPLDQVGKNQNQE